MAVTEAASLEFRLRSIQRLITTVFASLHQTEVLAVTKNFVDMFGVIFPVGRNTQRSTPY